MDLLKKEDIQAFDLLNKLCWQDNYFVEKRFRFLVEWDPNSLTHTSRYGYLPLSYCAGSPAKLESNTSQIRKELIFYSIKTIMAKHPSNLLVKDSDTMK